MKERQMASEPLSPPKNRAGRIIVLGASGTIGRATVQALVQEGYKLRCLLRSAPPDTDRVLREHPDVELRFGDLRDGQWVQENLRDLEGDGAAIISCVASRTGAPQDAWAVDYGVNKAALEAAMATGIEQFIMLSAICVQKPQLAFQNAKLAFEAELQASGVNWSIVRPTAFFKSLSGQMGRLRRGKPFLVFGDGKLTACTPISDQDLARFLVACLQDPAQHRRILPIGGPGPAMTPLDQGHAMFEALGQQPKFRHVPVALLDIIIMMLGVAGLFSAGARAKRELARIGRYYATESMLVFDATTARYSADMTPAFGETRLNDFYQALVAGETEVELGEHAVF